MDYEYKLVKYHDYVHLIEETVNLLNSEWPRSYNARCNGLQKSSDNFPCSLLLLQYGEQKIPKLVGYASISKVLGIEMSVIIESVIIDKSLRGCGLGRILMTESEYFVRRCGFTTIYLSTKDKCKFYEHLGYSNSHAVSPERAVTKLLTSNQVKNIGNCEPKVTKIKPAVLEPPAPILNSPPPPPPTPPVLDPLKVTNNASPANSIWMKKEL